MKLLNTFFRLLFLGGVLLTTIPSAAATNTDTKDRSLHDELAQQDALFFQRGFNECDMAYLDATISPDLKFYHDKVVFKIKHCL